MPRSKTLSDQDVLALAYKLMHEQGPEALTFDGVARACGLSAATLVQRFRSKAGLKQRTLLYAWDRLDEKTARLAATIAKTPDGAVGIPGGAVEGLWRDRSLRRRAAGAARGSSRSRAAGARRRLEGHACPASSTIASPASPMLRQGSAC